jgi:hypothetical protein
MISVILTSRNDNYGDSLKHRAFLSLQNFINRYDEVVYVDWNSEGESLLEGLKGLLSFRGNLKHIIVSNSDIHQIAPSLIIPFVEVIGRNVGIRRASHDFILSSNIDIIAGYPSCGLKNGIVYTAARRNVPQELYMSNQDPIALGDTLMANFMGIPTAPDSVDANGNAIWDPGDNFSLVVCGGDYQMAHRDVWKGIKGFEESMIYRGYADSNLMRKGQIYFRNEKIYVPIFHLNHTSNSMAVPQMNNQQEYGHLFQETKNSNTWGFSSYDFKTEVL